MQTSFSPAAKMICGGLLVGIALTALLNIANHPRASAASEVQARRAGYTSSADMVASDNQINAVFGAATKALIKGRSNGLSPRQYAEAEKMLRIGSLGTKRMVIMMIAHDGYLYGKKSTNGFTAGRMPPEAFRLLSQQATSPTPEVRSLLAHAISWCKDPAVRNLFASMSRDPDADVRDYVTNYLREDASDAPNDRK